MPRDVLMGGDRQWVATLTERVEDARVRKIDDRDIGARIVLAYLSDDALQPTDALTPRVLCILIVVDGELDEEEIDGTLREHVGLESEGAGRRARRGDAGVGEVNLALWKARRQPALDEGSVAVHLGDRAAEEGHVSLSVPFEPQPQVLKAASEAQISKRRRVLEDEVGDRGRVFEGVGVVTDSIFLDDSNPTSQLAVARRENRRVLFGRHDLVRHADDVEQWDVGSRQGLEVLEGAAAKLTRRLFREVPGSQAALPVGWAAAASLLAARPAADVENGSIGIDARHTRRVLRGKSVRDEAPAAHRFECSPIGEAVFLGQEAPEGIVMSNRLVIAVEPGDIRVDQMVATRQHRDVGLRFVSEEARPPDPGATGQLGLRRDDDGGPPAELEVVPLKTVEAADLARKPVRCFLRC